MDRQSTSLLFALVLLLACGDWLVSPTIAQRDDANDAVPVRIAPSAFLTGQPQDAAVVHGLDVSLEGAAEPGFTLVFHNPSAEARTARLEVECVQASGSPWRRIPPIPSVVHTETVEVTVAAGATVRTSLEAEVAPAEPNPSALAEFTTTSFRLRQVGQAADVAPLAVLRWSGTPVVQADVEAG